MLIQTPDEIHALTQDIERAENGWIAVDTETSGLIWSRDRLLGISLAWRIDGQIESAYLPLSHPPGLFSRNCSAAAVNVLLSKLFAVGKQVIFHNALFDLHFLEKLCSAVDFQRIFDTQVATRMLGKEAETGDRPSLALIEVAKANQGLPAKTYDRVPTLKKDRGALQYQTADATSWYAEQDARMTYGLGELFIPMIADDPLWKIELQFLSLLNKMERQGLLIDRAFIDDKRRSFRSKQEEIERQFMSQGLRDISSNRKVGVFLYDTLGLPVGGYTEKGARSVAVGALVNIKEHEAVGRILEWRQLNKAISSWLDPFLLMADNADRLHPSFDAAGTVSGRISCRRPNLQAVPVSDRGQLAYRSLKGIFIPPPGFELWAFDYKQADLRVATAYARESRMAEIFGGGGDPYSAMAEEIWGGVNKERRQLAKQISLATINSLGAATLAHKFNISEAKAHQALTRHRRAFSAFPIMSRLCEARFKNRGQIRLWTGRTIYHHPNEKTHLAFSRLVQGGVAEMIKRAMLTVEDRLEPYQSRQLLQIHDSTVVEIAVDERDLLVPQIVQDMESALPQRLRERVTPAIHMKIDQGKW